MDEVKENGEASEEPSFQISEKFLSELDGAIDSWTDKIRRAMETRKFKELRVLKQQLTTLLFWRAQYLKGIDVRDFVIKLIDARRELDESFTVPRAKDGFASEDNTRMDILYQMHINLQKRVLEGTQLPTNVSEQYSWEARNGLRLRSKDSVDNGKVSLWMDMKMAMFSAGEPCKLYFSLWQSSQGFITEEFCVSITSLGLPDDQNLIGELFTTFAGLTRSQFATSIFLVCRIYRVGSLVFNEGSRGGLSSLLGGGNNADVKFQRPYGVGILPLNMIETMAGGIEYTDIPQMTIYRPSNENNFATLHEVLARERLGEMNESGVQVDYEVVPKSNGIVLSLCLLEGDVVTGNMDDITSVCRQDEVKEKIMRSPPTRMLALNDDTSPRDMRNELYISILDGIFSQDKKTSAKNIEVKGKVLLDSGVALPCLVRGTGRQVEPENEFSTTILYHSNNPSLHETFKVVIPDMDELERAHLLLFFFHRSSGKPNPSPFGFSFFPLSDPTTKSVVLDGDYSLPSYELLSKMTPESTSVTYLNDTSKLKQRTLRQGIQTIDEVVNIRLKLSSTKKTNIPNVHKILNWQSGGSDTSIAQALKGCMSVSQVDLMRYLREILNNIFQLFREKPNLKGEIFQFWVYLLDFFSREVFKEYRPLIDIYINEYLQDPHLYKVSISALRDALDIFESDEDDIEEKSDPRAATQKRKLVTNTINAFTYIIQFIRRSHEIQDVQESKLDETAQERRQMKQELEVIFNVINNIMQREGPVWIKPLQGKLLKNFFTVIQEVSFIFSAVERAEITKRYLSSIQFSDSEKSMTNADRLSLVRDVTRSDMFRDSTSRAVLLPFVIDILEQHMGHSKEDTKESISIFGTVLGVTESMGSEQDREEVFKLFIQHTHVLINVAEQFHEKKGRTHSMVLGDSSNEMDMISDGTVNLCSLMKLTTDDKFVALLEAQHDGGKQLLYLLLTFFDKVVTNCPFPSVWVVMKMMLTRVVVALIQRTGRLLIDGRFSNFTILDAAKLENGDDYEFQLEESDSDSDYDSDYDSDEEAAQSTSHTGGAYLRERGFRSSVVNFSSGSSIEEQREALRRMDSMTSPDKPTRKRRSIIASSSIADVKIWVLFFNLSIHLLEDKELDLNPYLNRMKPTKRDFLATHYGDLRSEIIPILTETWESLGEKQFILVNKLVKPSLFLVNNSLKSASEWAKKVYIDLTRSEFRQGGNFNRVGRHTIDSVDEIVGEEHSTLAAESKTNASGSTGDVEQESDEYSENPKDNLFNLFQKELGERFAEDVILNSNQAITFASEVRQLFTLLRNLSRYSNSPEFEEERVFAYGKLMDFLFKLGRMDSYIKYGSNLKRDLLQLGLKVEAAFALLLYANHLDWRDDVDLPGVDLGENVLPLPPAKEWERKESLYHEAADLFEQGEYFEGSIRLWEELRNHYQNNLLNYPKLMNAHQKLGSLVEKIMQTERYPPSVFRVGYYGNFPEEIKNKDFVYRGAPLESIMDFSARVRMKWPDADNLAPKIVPDEEYFNSEEQFLQISKLTPASEEEYIGRRAPNYDDLPPYIAINTINNGKSIFYYTKTFRKNQVKSENEFLDLWVEKVLVKTPRPFPDAQRRMQVVDQNSVVINPFEMAVQTMMDKNKELRDKVQLMESLANGQADQSITMALNGVVDAAVNGGLKSYIPFLTGEYALTNPEIYDDMEDNPQKAYCTTQLKKELLAQLNILREAIPVHKYKCSEAMLPLHEHMEMMFESMNKEMMDIVNSEPINIRAELSKVRGEGKEGDDSDDSDEEDVVSAPTDTPSKSVNFAL